MSCFSEYVCFVPGADINDQALAAIELSAIAVQVQLRSM
uniref:Uncharacterized protein n=1 Tax=Raoultella ornithinolytica TaxID=54291 RepID=A0A2H4ZGI9_RAOOR|nr:Hypothetical protein [Raoultella ornithinolytica]